MLGTLRRTISHDDVFGKLDYLFYRFNIVPCPLDRVPIEQQRGINHTMQKPYFLCMENKLVPIKEYNYSAFNIKKAEEIYIEGIMGSKELTEVYITFERCVNGTDVGAKR